MFLHFPSDPLRRTKAITTGIVAIGGVIMLAAWLVAGLSIVAERETAIDHARSEVGNLTAALADEVTHALDNVTAAMEIVAQRMRAAPRALDIHDWAREIRLLQETIPGSIVGPDGRLVSTTLNPSPEPIDLSDRQYFRAHLDENVHGIFISKPVTDRISHQVTFPVSRRVDAADGRFLGVIVFSLSPGDLTGLYKMVDLGKRGTIVLTGLDNIIRARFSRESPDGLDGLGESIAGGSRPATFAENASGFYTRNGVVDGVRRLVGYRRVANYPLVANVGLDLNEVLAPWRTHALIIGGFTATATILFAGLAAYLACEMRRRAEHEIELAKERKNLAAANERLQADIALRHEVEQRLRDTTDTLRDAVDSISDAFVIYDKNDFFVMCNEAFRQAYPETAWLMQPGTSFEAIVRNSIASGRHIEAVGREDEWIAERLQSRRNRSRTIEQRHRDGRWFLITDRPMRNGGIAGLRIDITQLKAVEARLRQTQDNLSRAQRMAKMGSCVRDLVTDVEEWSDETYRIFGVDKSSFTPTMENRLNMVIAEDQEKVRARRDNIAKGISLAPIEYRIRRPDGEIRHIYRETEVIRDETGKPVCAASTFRDVTELRATEQRERDLEQQLQQSQKLEALGTLAGGIAHDLNNALMPILALTEMASRQMPEGSSTREDLEMVVCAARRGRELVRQILAFSRNETPTKTDIDLAAVVRQSLQMLRATFPATMRLDERIDNVPPVTADAGQVQQVVVNLVTNAMQAVGEGMGVITVELSTDPGATGPGNCGSDRIVRLRVADTGCGMDPGTMKRIFEPFFTTKAVGEGTGLGLSVVHGIVTSHSGRIEVRSRPGHGTTFIVSLPTSAQATPSEAAAA